MTPCRRLSGLVSSGDAEGTKIVLDKLMKNSGRETTVHEITTCDFGDRGTQSALHVAATRGYTKIIRMFLQCGAPAGSIDDPGNTPLHYACERGHARAAWVLLEGGASFDASNNFGKTPRHNLPVNSWDAPAVSEGKAAIARILEQGFSAVPFEELPPEPKPGEKPAAQPPRRGGDGPFAFAVQRQEAKGSSDQGGQSAGGWFQSWFPRVDSSAGAPPSEVSTAATTRDNHPDTGKRLLLAELVRRGDVAAVEYRLKEAFAIGGKDEAIREATNCEDDTQDSRIIQSPMHVAASTGNVPILRLLLATNADVNLRTDTGDTLLHVAATYGREEVVAELLKAGANPKIKNNFGRGVVDHAEPQPWEPEEVQQRKGGTRRSLLRVCI